MKRFLAGTLCTLCLGLGSAFGENRTQTLTVLSPVYKIDKVIKSMEGPQSTQPVYLLSAEPPELLWITGFKTEMVAADGKTPSLPEFMCHVNVDYNRALHHQIFPESSAMNTRILTLSQGHLEAFFPEGFGIPMMSNEPLSMNTQVLNFNLENPNREVRHKVTFQFVRDQDLKAPMKPLFNTSGFGMALLEGPSGHFGIGDANETMHGESCLPGENAPNAQGGSIYTDHFQKKFSGHWVVKPGREVNHTNITTYLSLPFDTTLHYAAVHLHPFAESLELRDITAKKSVFKSKARGFKDKIGLTHVSAFSSKKGVPLYKDHQYELISIYNNTTSVNQDSMAVMMLFLLDKRFKKPTPGSLAGPSVATLAPPLNPHDQPHLVLRTTVGDLVAELYPSAAPKTVSQIVRLVNGEVYTGVPFHRIEPGFVVQLSNAQDRSQPLTADQRAMLQRIPGEFNGGIPHERGVLSMARYDNDPDGAESSFSILLGKAPHLDGKYAAFGKVTRGWETLKALEAAPREKTTHRPLVPIRILQAEIFSSSKEAEKIRLKGPKSPKSSANSTPPRP